MLREQGRLTPLALMPPEFCNLFGGLVQPVLISREPNHFDGSNPLGRIRGGIAQRSQLTDGHQNEAITGASAGMAEFGRGGCLSALIRGGFAFP